MRHFLQTTLLCSAAIFGICTQASALTQADDVLHSNAVIQEAAYSKLPILPVLVTPQEFNVQATIGIARLDKGRLIAAPFGELQDWAFLNKRTAQNFDIISPAALMNNLPNVPMYGRDSDNKLDEIRMTASDLRMDYVLVYGMGQDAQWGSFGNKSMMETGFVTNEQTVSPRGGAKALLVNTYTGEVYGTVTSDEIEFGIGDLTDKVQSLVNRLGVSEQHEEA